MAMVFFSGSFTYRMGLELEAGIDVEVVTKVKEAGNGLSKIILYVTCMVARLSNDIVNCVFRNSLMKLFNNSTKV